MALSSSQSLGSLGLGSRQRLPNRSKPGPTCKSSEAQLRAARVEIDREKLHTVVDHPFFNQLRFKELEMRLITLEFTGDGRFAYCEKGMHKEMTIYEGVLVKPTGTSMRMTVEATDEDQEEQQDTSGPSTEAGDCAVIEGRANVRYEKGEADCGLPFVTNVERGEYRFSITVKPCFKSTEMEAWVQPLFMSAGQRQMRKHLALVDASGSFLGEAFGEKNLPEIVSRPNSRSGFSRALFLEQAADPKRYALRQNRSSTGLEKLVTKEVFERTRSMKKYTYGSSSLPSLPSSTLRE